MIYIHLSIDDVWDSLWDISNNEMTHKSIFDNTFFRYLKLLNDSFGCLFSLYTFYAKDGDRLSDFTGEYAKEFSSNNCWMRFAFHSDSDKEPTSNKGRFYMRMAETRDELKRITGDYIPPRYVRLHFFYGTKKDIEQIMEYNIEGVLCSDADDRISYDLNKEEHDRMRSTGIIKKNNMTYIPTDIRVERIERIKDEVEKIRRINSSPERPAVIFTHEWALKSKENSEKLVLLLDSLAESDCLRFVI